MDPFFILFSITGLRERKSWRKACKRPRDELPEKVVTRLLLEKTLSVTLSVIRNSLAVVKAFANLTPEKLRAYSDQPIIVPAGLLREPWRRPSIHGARAFLVLAGGLLSRLMPSASPGASCNYLVLILSLPHCKALVRH